MRVLLAAHPTVGHTQALRAVGAELKRRGHVVDFAISRVPSAPAWLPVPQPLRAARGVIEALHDEGYRPIHTPFSLRAGWAASRVAATRGYDELGWAVDVFTRDALPAARVLALEVVRRRVDLIVHDFAFFGAWLAAGMTRAPSVAVFHSGLPFPVPGAAPFGSGLDADAPAVVRATARRRLDRIASAVDRKLGRARRRLGLAPIAPRLLERPYSEHLNVLTTHEAFELPRPDLERRASGPVLWSGPCTGDRSLAGADFPWERLEGDAPLVYVSLGTVFNDQPEIYRALLDAVHGAGARAVVAAGASYDAIRGVGGPDDVVVRFAPQVALLERVDLVIGHGGNNTLVETLRAGRPLLAVPFGAEQIANAQRLESLGVGRRLHLDGASIEELSSAVREALDGPMRDAARALSAAIPRGDGAPVIAAALERIGR